MLLTANADDDDAHNALIQASSMVMQKDAELLEALAKLKEVNRGVQPFLTY